MKAWAAIALIITWLGVAPVRAVTPDNTLVIAISLNGIISFDPAESFETISNSCLDALYQGLVKSDRTQPTALAADLALSWHEGRDPHSLIFTLDPNAVFASGNPVLADDVVYSLRRAIKLNKTPVFILNELGWRAENIDEQVRKIDEHQLELRWSGNLGSERVLYLLSSPVARVVDSNVLLQHNQADDFGNAWLKTHSAGSGSYQIRHYLPQQALLLESNPYASRPPRLAQVILKDVTDPGVRRLLLLQGDVDIAYDLGADPFSALENQPGVNVNVAEGAKIYYLGFNTQDSSAAFLGHPAFWQAARWLVDYTGIAHRLLKHQYQVQQNFLPRGFEAAARDKPFHLDVEKAKRILAQAGIAAGSRFTLLVANQPPYVEVAQALQDSFAQADIRIDVQVVVESELWTRMRSGRFQAVLTYWGPDYIDPNSNASAFAYNLPGGPNTLAARLGWVTPELSQLTRKASAERDPQLRRELYLQLQQAIRENSPFVVMLQGKRLVAVRNHVLNVRQSIANSMLYFDEIEKEALK
ncbi:MULTISPECIES: ABC transporter substrate-binding protein [Dickeya]|uniref:Dipeptide-binding ABC transporter, periplasmic substrate-binding component (TC 3.A.1.5.2) n=1 Tax=Dickeya aquatica TaxID=1401087 RepID=A0A375ABY3_9GAMM|nr:MULTISPECIES: ABC transporter substrate-binding protein [Dickeya]SLM63461.1 Dipeptide-binding ABC transporter, periplasmic substrate-binding component (TC 3.A.1.5.2) [Dickeya aquatica]